MTLDFSHLFDSNNKSEVVISQNDSSENLSDSSCCQNQEESIGCCQDIYKQYQCNIAKSEQLLTDIRKGVLSGENIYCLFIKAVQAISCITSDQLFETEIKENIKKIYGDVLKEPQVLELKMKEAQNRLDKLTTALQVEEDPSSLKRVRRAIEEHEKYISAIKTHLSSS